MKNVGGKSIEKHGQSLSSIPPANLLSSLQHYFNGTELYSAKPNPLNIYARNNNTAFKIITDTKPKQLIAIINKDIALLQKAKSSYDSIIYLTSDNSYIEPSKKQLLLESINSDCKVDILPFDLFNKSTTEILDSSAFVNQDLVNARIERLTRSQTVIPILNRIYDHVFSIPEPVSPPPVPAETSFAQLDNKLVLNFANHLRQDVQNDILSFWQTKMIIENYIKHSYSHFRKQFDFLKSFVMNSYLSFNKQTSDDRVQDIEIFNKMAQAILPNDLKDDPNALGCAKAVVYYFFEYCVFGKKREDEPLTFNFPES